MKGKRVLFKMCLKHQSISSVDEANGKTERSPSGQIVDRKQRLTVYAALGLYEVAGGQRSGPCAPATPCLGVSRCSQTDFHQRFHRRRRLNQTATAGQFAPPPHHPLAEPWLARFISILMPPPLPPLPPPPPVGLVSLSVTTLFCQHRAKLPRSPESCRRSFSLRSCVCVYDYAHLRRCLQPSPTSGRASCMSSTPCDSSSPDDCLRWL